MPDEKNRIQGMFDQEMLKAVAPEQAPAVEDPLTKYMPTIKTLGNVLDVALLTSFLFYIITNKPAPRKLLFAGAMAVGLRLARNLNVIPKQLFAPKE